MQTRKFSFLMQRSFLRIFVQKIGKFFVLLLLIPSLVFPFSIPVSYAAPGVPKIVSYQGRLLDASGNLLGGSSGTTYYFKFSIWDSATVGLGNRLWPASAPSSVSATVTSGVFNVNIGDTANGYPTALDYNFNTNQDVFVQVEVSSDNVSFETLSPRQRLAAAAFSRIAEAVSGIEQTSIGTTTPIGLSQLTVEATSTAAVGLTVRAASGHTANIFQIQNNAGSNLLFTNASGGLFASSSLQVSGNSILYGTLGVGTTSPSETFAVHGGAFFSGNVFGANFVATGTTKFGGITYTWPTSLVAGNVLQTDSNGNLSWASVSGGGGSDANWSFIESSGGYVRLATTTNRIGIGTTTPYAKLSINSGGIATTTLALVPVVGQTANVIDIYNSAGELTSVYTAAGRFGIGTTSPGQLFSAQGNALISGNLFTANVVATGTVTMSEITTPVNPSINNLSLFTSNKNGISILSTLDATGFETRLGRDSFIIGRNTTGSTLNKGETVYISGSTGNTPTFSRAQADTDATLPAIGVVAESISHNSFGRALISGLLSNFDTSAFAEGDAIYVATATAGSFTNVRPIFPFFAQRIGVVTNSGIGNGSIEIDAQSIGNIFSTANGKAGLGTSTPGQFFSVQGSGLFSGDLSG